MTFTFPILTLSKGGAQRVLAEITNQLTKRGHRVVILMPIGGAVEYPVDSELLRIERDVLSESDYPAADVIVSNYYLTVPSAIAASERGKGTHVRYSLCYEPPILPQSTTSYSSYHETDRLIVVSHWQKELMRLLYGIESPVAPPGVGPAFVNQKRRNGKSRVTISAILRMPESYTAHRGQEYLVQELDRIAESHPEIEIRYITPFSEYVASPTLQRMSVDNQHRFLTPADDAALAACYNQADIFVTPSTYESFGMPGLEAMKCGAALVAIYSGGNAEYCRSEENSLISYLHERRLREDIVRLIEDAELRNRLAAQGEHDAKSFTWERSGDLFEEAIRQFVPA